MRPSDNATEWFRLGGIREGGGSLYDGTHQEAVAPAAGSGVADAQGNALVERVAADGLPDAERESSPGTIEPPDETRCMVDVLAWGLLVKSLRERVLCWFDMQVNWVASLLNEEPSVRREADLRASRLQSEQSDLTMHWDRREIRVCSTRRHSPVRRRTSQPMPAGRDDAAESMRTSRC